MALLKAGHVQTGSKASSRDSGDVCRAVAAGTMKGYRLKTSVRELGISAFLSHNVMVENELYASQVVGVTGRMRKARRLAAMKAQAV